jgi:hypothetical protein
MEMIHCAVTRDPTRYCSLRWEVVSVVRSSMYTTASFDKHSAMIQDRSLTRVKVFNSVMSSSCTCVERPRPTGMEA